MGVPVAGAGTHRTRQGGEGGEASIPFPGGRGRLAHGPEEGGVGAPLRGFRPKTALGGEGGQATAQVLDGLQGTPEARKRTGECLVRLLQGDGDHRQVARPEDEK